MPEYDNGGDLRTGVCRAHNGAAVPEMVFSHSPLREQIERAKRWVADHYDAHGEFRCPGDDDPPCLADS